MADYAQVQVNYGSSSSYVISLTEGEFEGLTASAVISDIIEAGGFWNGSTFVPVNQITSYVAS